MEHNSFLSTENTKLFFQHRKRGSPYSHLEYKNLSPKANAFLQNEANAEQEEYLFVYPKPCIIEPVYGWALTPEFDLIVESYPYGKFVQNQFKPNLTAYKYKAVNKITIDKAVLLWENTSNYFHFINNFMGRLALLDRLNISKEIPIIISEDMSKGVLFKKFKELFPAFLNRNWVVQSAEVYYEIKEKAYFSNVIDCDKNNFLPLLQEVDRIHSDSIPNKLFITRGKTEGRRPSNMEEIEAIATNFGFEIIDTGNLTLADQIKKFRNATAIVGLHGSGLINIIFSKQNNLKVLELFPGNFVWGGFYWLADQFGFGYDALTGENTNVSKIDSTATTVYLKENFYLSPILFKEKLEQYFD